MAKRGHRFFALSLLGAAIGSTAIPVNGQVIISGGTAAENASGDKVGVRSPGRMVGSGVARAADRAASFRAGADITETSRPLSPGTQFLSEAIEEVFAQINDALTLLINVLFLRAGETPPVIADFPPDNTADGNSDSAPDDNGRAAGGRGSSGGKPGR